jgi:hypothetical protein
MALALSETAKIVLRTLLDHPGLKNADGIVGTFTGTEKQLSTNDVSAALNDLAQRGLVVYMPDSGELHPTDEAIDNRDALLG